MPTGLRTATAFAADSRSASDAQRLREEIASLGSNDGSVPHGSLDRLVLTEYAFKESLRLMPPVLSIPRRALRDFEFGGYRIPAGTFVGEADERTVEVHLGNLRRKIGDDVRRPRWIETVRGIGYRLTAAPQSVTAD